MSIKFKYLIFCVFIYTYSFSQVNDLYLISNIGTIDTCNYSPYRDGRDKKLVKFEHKFKYGCFIFGNQHFKIKNRAKICEINSNEFKKLTISNLDIFFRKRELFQNQLKNPNQLYKSIYILVPTINNNFLKIEVEWKEIFINSDDESYKYIK